MWSGRAFAQTVFFFQDSNNGSYYNSGLAFATAPSTILQAGPTNDKIPVTFTPAPVEGTNSLRLRWQSNAGGDWSALVIAPAFQFQNISQTDTLSFWCYAPVAIAAADMPAVSMEGAPGNTKSRKYALGPFSGDIPAQTWVQVKVPLTVFFNDPNQTNINFSQIKAIILGQQNADGATHELLVDDVRTYRVASGGTPAPMPTGLTATGYDSHVELTWQPNTGTNTANYRLYRSLDGGATYSLHRIFNGQRTSFIDFTRPQGNNLSLGYRISAVGNTGQESALTDPVLTATYDMTDDELMTMVQQYTFRYFWDFAHPVSGLSRERDTAGETVTMGGSGFGIMAILVGIERGFITYQEGLDRLLTMVSFLENADRFHGAYPHWMNGTTGDVIPFSPQDNGGDIVETAFLFEGLLAARSYFGADDVLENLLRQKITQLWETVEWDWYRKLNQPVMYWHWSPTVNYAINFQLRGWNETMIVYLLGAASPTHGIPGSMWETGWTANSNYANGFNYYGYRLPVGSFLGGPLFFTHYSFIGFDPRYVRDGYTNYFVQNRNQTLINRAYCIANPGGYVGYSANCWGLTASDNPFGYLAHEPKADRDNGTIAPTAALSSMPYTPNVSMDALKYFYREQGQSLWGPMGFYDAFNLTQGWFADSYLAIDQGPIITMIENHRTQLLWNNFMANPEIQPALTAMGFVPDSVLTTTATIDATPEWVSELSPNPVEGRATLQLHLPDAQRMTVTLVNTQGQTVAVLAQKQHFGTGAHSIPFDGALYPKGNYYLWIQSATRSQTIPFININH